jgi:serine/threonine-protein kinase
MIDGRGKVRITDFGLAGVAGSFCVEESRAGTPAYMAPEQLAGTDASLQSDIYGLGLVLYEVFTGKRAFEAATLAELRRAQEHSSPTNPSLLV